MKRREFLSAIGAGVAMSQVSARAQGGRPLAPGEVRGAKPPAPPPPVRKATITKLFKTPDGHPNALDVSPEGFWIGEQVTDRVILMDINGKVLQAFQTECHNCSGLAVGGGYLWLSANGAAQFDRPIKIESTELRRICNAEMDGTVVKRHTVPLGGGGVTGLEYVDGTLWMVASRLRALMQVNAETFQPILAHPFQIQRPHGLALDNGSMWVVDGVDEPRLVKLDAKTGAIRREHSTGARRSRSPWARAAGRQALLLRRGHSPGWERDKSPHTGWLCRVDLS